MDINVISIFESKYFADYFFVSSLMNDKIPRAYNTLSFYFLKSLKRVNKLYILSIAIKLS
jgi:hypothetical protein